MSKNQRHKRRCFWCHGTTKTLTRDHLVPLAFGGNDSDDNIRRACFECNQERGTIVQAALTVFRAAREDRKEKSQLSARLFWDGMKDFIAKWGELERLRLGGGWSISDKLGTAEYPFREKTQRKAKFWDEVKESRKRAEAATSFPLTSSPT